MESKPGRCLGWFAKPIAPEMCVCFNYNALRQITRGSVNGKPRVLDTRTRGSTPRPLTKLTKKSRFVTATKI